MVQVRCFDISQLQPGDYDRLYTLACEDRKCRADRYRKMEDRIRCVAADALLGLVPGLSRENLCTTPAGKLYLKDQPEVQFNLSHSGRWVAVAWGSTPLGIDVEQLSMDEGKEQIARRYFHPHEQTYVFSASGEERERRFFQVWTMKESYLKYLGTGINRPLNSFSVLSSQLGVELVSECLPDACVTVCSEDGQIDLQMVTREQLRIGSF